MLQKVSEQVLKEILEGPIFKYNIDIPSSNKPLKEGHVYYCHKTPAIIRITTKTPKEKKTLYDYLISQGFKFNSLPENKQHAGNYNAADTILIDTSNFQTMSTVKNPTIAEITKALKSKNIVRKNLSTRNEGGSIKEKSSSLSFEEKDSVEALRIIQELIPSAWRLNNSVVIPNRLLTIFPKKAGTPKEKVRPKKARSKKAKISHIGSDSPFIEMMLPFLNKFQKVILSDYEKNTAAQFESEKEKMISELKKDYYLIPIEGNEITLTIELSKFKMNGEKITFNKNALKKAN